MFLTKRPFLFCILSCWALALSFSESIAGFEVIVLDCAQGNIVVAKYKGKAMVFDAGSSASSKFVHFEDDHGNESIIKRKYVIDDQTDKLRKKEVPAERYKLKVNPKNNRVYRKSFIDEFKTVIYGEDQNDTLKAVFISHPDIDHYNLVEPAGLTPHVFVLGGKYELYKNKKFRKHLQKHLKAKKKVIYDKKYGSTDPLPRFQNHKVLPRFGKKKGSPTVEILGVNAGKTGRDKDKNTDSMIIKVSKRHSLLIPGDAEAKTWEDALRESGEAALKADVLLLSHHGAMTNESTSDEILKTIDPKACLISAGFQHDHPTSVVINLLLEHYKTTSYRTDPHFVTFQEGKTRKSILTNAPIFTTIDNGALTVDLSSKNLSITCSRDFDPIPQLSFVESKGAMLSLKWTENHHFVGSKALQELNGSTPASNDTPFGQDVYRIQSDEGSSEEDWEDYYYKIGHAYLKMKLLEEDYDSEGESVETSVPNVWDWFKTHKSVYESNLTFLGVER